MPDVEYRHAANEDPMWMPGVFAMDIGIYTIALGPDFL